jgi:stress-induced morphogen
MIDIRKKIQSVYPDSQVWVHEFSGGTDHFRVLIFSPQLNNLPRLEQHRAVYRLFETEMNSGQIHAFSLQFLKQAPEDGDFDVGFQC